MQPFPSETELSHLIGEVLEQVRFDPHSCQLLFEKTKILAVLALEQVDVGGRVWRYENIASEAGPSMLHQLLGLKVSGLRSAGLQLTLEFENGAQLRLFSDLEPYEAGTIESEGRFVVF